MTTVPKAIPTRTAVGGPVRARAGLAAPLLAAALTLCSCGRNSADVRKAAALREAVAACRAAVEQADSAARAADICQEAEAAASELTALAEASRNKAVADAARTAQDDLAAIRRAYGNAACKVLLDREMGGLTVGAYVARRGSLVSAEFKALEIAARSAASRSAPKAARRKTMTDMESRALHLACAMADSPPLSDGAPDWARVADDIAALARNQPPELNLLLALGHSLDGDFDLALAELSLCREYSFRDKAGLTAADWSAAYHLLRAIALHAHGWQPLADDEFARTERMLGDTTLAAELPPQRTRCMTACRLALACHAGLEKKDLPGMDRHLAWIVSARPDSGIVAYLAGRPGREPDGSKSEGHCLESDMRTPNHKAAARIIANRLRAAIEGRPASALEQASLDPFLLPEVLAALFVAEAADPESARAVRELIAFARDMAGPRTP